MAKSDPGGVAHRERRRGFWPDAEGMVGMPAGRCFGDLFLRVGKGLRTTRRMRPEYPVPRQTSGVGMGARGSPRNGRSSRR